MKNLIFLLIAGHCASYATAQDKALKNYTPDSELSPWVLDANLYGGGYLQQMDKAAIDGNYLNGVNVNTGKLKFDKGGAVGAAVQLGYFFGKSKMIGLGTGLLYMRQWGNLSLDHFHAEYQSVDDNAYIFRQVVSATNITEKVKIDNFNIPVVLKFKNRSSKHWGFTADAGVLINLQMKSNYTTNAAFDYEAIYKFENGETGNLVPVYDYASIPDKTDFLITKDQFTKNNPTGNVTDYFNTKRDAGYHVGLGVKPKQQSGSASYNTPSLGFIFQPAVNYFFSDHVALNLGAYFTYQPFKNDASNNYTTTGMPGEYNSIVNSASKIQTQSFGAVLGLRFFLGNGAKKMHVVAVNEFAPSNCGLCDGSFALQGLKPNKAVSVNYKHNGALVPNTFSGTADKEGNIVLPNLCAGNYSDIKAIIDKRSVSVAAVELKQPSLTLGLAEWTNPTAPDKCDGTIKMNGLIPGQTATINYTLGGIKTEKTVLVAADHSAQVSGLCAGSYDQISIASNDCYATLDNPSVVLLEQAAPATVAYEADDSLKHVLFDFNESSIRSVSYPLIDEAYAKLKADTKAYILIDGNTDKVGTEAYNQQLSLRRANAVKDYLIAKGVRSSRIEIKGNGERTPIAPNNTGAGRQKNRRVEMIIKL